MSKKKKTAEIVCAAVMLAMAVPFTVWAQEQVDVETLERQAENMETFPTETQNEEFTYQDVQGLNFAFSSGVGAWGTVLTIQEDGSFEGNYHDTNMGETGEGYPNGTVYVCDFSGKFTEPEKINEYTYSAEIQSITYGKKPETSEIIDGMKRIYSEPYGLERAERILFYTQGAPIAELPEGYRSWVGYYDINELTETGLPFIGLYNEAQEEGFSSFRNEEEEGAGSEESAIDAELAELEAREAELNQEADSYADQSTINITAQEIYTLWDDELNSMWARIREILPADSFDALTQEQLAWIADKEAAVEAAVAEIGGGSMSASVEFGTGADITKERVYQLAEYLR